jgi:type IV secretion system protein VirB10
MRKSALFFCFLGCLQAQQQQPPAPVLKERPEVPANSVQVDTGTHILLSMINSVSTKQSVVGDRIYLETAFPVLVNGKMVVPRGSWVIGTVTEITRPKRGLKGTADIAVRFDSLTLPNGVSRSFRSSIGALDATNDGTLNRETGAVNAPGNAKENARTVLITTASGAAIGTAVGAASGHIGGGGLIGVAGGAAGGLVTVLASRRPDAMLQRGMTVEMVLDRPIFFSLDELAGADSGRGAR